MTETTYTDLRQRLASVLDRVANDHEVVIVRRRGEKTVALVPADELAGLMETAQLLRSPKNARRLLAALQRAVGGKGKPEPADKEEHRKSPVALRTTIIRRLLPPFFIDRAPFEVCVRPRPRHVRQCPVLVNPLTTQKYARVGKKATFWVAAAVPRRTP